ncbi:Uncharacterised protein [Vibrio cholerae]|nr:Uncharacterised protein [Vibrio cholerae]CSB17347.1 Uncharacterised protein [Vibrio cholerae]CSI68325.1 Uncharacterised protein [Vibrio cholerae]
MAIATGRHVPVLAVERAVKVRPTKQSRTDYRDQNQHQTNGT